MKWFYVIHGTGDRLVKRSEAIYEKSSEALKAGNEYLEKNKPSLFHSANPQEVFSVMTGQK
jgi:hypothetical protein